MQYLMVIDAGTGSVRVIVFDTLGNQISLSQYEWTHSPEEGVQNSMNFDCKQNWLLVVKCIGEAIHSANIQSSSIIAISATSMREGIVLYDKNNKEIWAVANVDARASKQVQRIKENFIGIEEEFYLQSGQTFALGAIPRILWLKDNKPNIYQKIAKISMISDWILFKLSGIIVSEPSNGGTTGIFSLKNRNWLPQMADKIGIKSDIFPPILECGEVIGTVTQSTSRLCRLSTNTKIVVGGGDVQMGSVGLGVTDISQVAVIGGSFWQQVVNIDKNTPPLKDMNIRVNPHIVPRLSQAEGITFFSGLVMRWFRDAFCDMEKLQAKKQNIDVYALLEEKAKKIPIGSYGIIPIFSDYMKYSKWYHASPSFLNLSLDANKSNKASMFRSLQENACIISSINLENIKSFTNENFDEIVFAGGASKGTLWPQILADTTNCEIKIPMVTEATALGTAIVAGFGANIYDDISKSAKEIVTWDRVYTPNKDNLNKYNDVKSCWMKVYEEQLKLVDKNLLTSMWKAPGI